MTPELEASDRHLAGLLRELPQPAAHETLLLRVGRRGEILATLRCERGGPPRIYRLGDGPPQRLHLADDPALPGGRLLTDASAVAARLGSCVETTRLELLAYRPGARAVARVHRGPGQTLYYVKAHTERGFARARHALMTLHCDDPQLHLALPICYLPDACTAIAKEAPGRPLHGLLSARGGIDPAPLLGALRAFAALSLAELPERSTNDEHRATTKMLERALAFAPSLEPLLDQVCMVDPPHWSPCGTVHGDLHDKQIFVGAGTTALIDLEGASRGDPRLDWINLTEHLRLRSLQSGRRSGSDLAARLVDAFDLSGDRRDENVVRGLVRARLAGVYALRPQWHGLAQRMAQEATHLLAGRGAP